MRNHYENELKKLKKGTALNQTYGVGGGLTESNLTQLDRFNATAAMNRSMAFFDLQPKYT